MRLIVIMTVFSHIERPENRYEKGCKVMKMSAAKKIKMLLVERDMTLTDLSKLLNKSLSTMSGKMIRDNFSEKDLKQIADLLDYDYEAVFTDRNTGKQI